MQMRDPYHVLGVLRSATAEDIKRCFRGHAKKFHPDANTKDPKGAAHFAELTAAYKILSDEDTGLRLSLLGRPLIAPSPLLAGYNSALQTSGDPRR
jgi:preprotein translocase subunit Sec63